jgi:hypothetical protein
MVFGTILSGCLFILPAAVTTGVLVGWDAVRSGSNQKPIFTVPPGGGYGGGPGMDGGGRGNGIETDIYCDKTVGISPYVAKGYEQYTRELISIMSLTSPHAPCNWQRDLGQGLQLAGSVLRHTRSVFRVPD